MLAICIILLVIMAAREYFYWVQINELLDRFAEKKLFKVKKDLTTLEDSAIMSDEWEAEVEKLRKSKDKKAEE